MSMYKNKNIKELFDLKHMNDNQEGGFNYEENILNNSMSGYNFNSNTHRGFLDNFKYMLSHLFDQMHMVRNLKAWNIDKYYNKHNN